MISVFNLLALLLSLSAVFGWFNRRILHLPNTIGLLVMGLLASLLLLLLDVIWPGQALYRQLNQALAQIDFSKVVMDGMLAFLLFAGAMSVDVQGLRDRLWPILTLAVLGTMISTVVIGGLFLAAASLLDVPVSWPWALVFGALISPTDPIAVLSLLKNAQLPKRVQVQMQGEALFNDGIGLVLFTFLLGIAVSSGKAEHSAMSLLFKATWEAGGGLALGWVTGYIAHRGIKSIDDFAVEVLITLALVTATYAMADVFAISGPLSVVAAGLVIGHRSQHHAMSEKSERYVSTLWTLIDEILNSILFLLIGLEIVVLKFDLSLLGVALMAIPIALLGRLLAVSTPLLVFRWSKTAISAQNVPVLTLAGVHGGISVALALSLPANAHRPVILAATYAVVLFTLIVSGLTLSRVAKLTVHTSD